MPRSVIYQRILWKESQELWRLWLAFAVIAVLLQTAARVLSPSIARVDADGLFGIALVLTALYCAGCGASLFAGEREAGVYEFLRSLPISSRDLLLAKTRFALRSIGALALFTAFSAAVLSGFTLPNKDWWWETGAYLGSWGIEFFLGTVLCSLLLRRVLVAAVLGALLGMAIPIFFARLFDYLASFLPEPNLFGRIVDTTQAVFALRMTIAIVMAVIDFRLGCRWLRGSGVRWTRIVAFRSAKVAIDLRCFRGAKGDSPRNFRGAKGDCRAGLGRLVWQSLRQSAAPAVFSWVAPLVPAIMLADCLLGWFDGSKESAWSRAAALHAVLIGLLTGTFVFAGDWRGRAFRFFADRGVPPGTFWLGRQIAWLLLTAVLILPHAALLLARNPRLATLAGSLAIVGYAVGQFTSMLMPRSLVAGLFGLMLTAAFSVWGALMFVLEVPGSLSVAPVAAALLAATRLRAHDWLHERNSRPAWLVIGLVLAAPLLVLPPAVWLYRVYEIPAVDPGFSPEEYDRPCTPDEQATAAIYSKCLARFISLEDVRLRRGEGEQVAPDIDRLQPPVLRPAHVDWLEANHKIIDRIVEATRRPAPNFCEPSAAAMLESPLSRHHHLGDLGNLLIADGLQLEQSGNLDGACDRYLAALRLAAQAWHRSPDLNLLMMARVWMHWGHWAAHPGQTPQRILAAMHRVDAIFAALPSVEDSVKTRYLLRRRLVLSQESQWARLYWPQSIQHFSDVLRWLPRERARLLRIVDQLARYDLERARGAEVAVRAGRRIPVVRDANAACREHPAGRWLRTTCSYFDPDKLMAGSHDAEQCLARMEDLRRTTRVMLAIEAWKLEHGRLPDSLDDVVGKDLSGTAVNPISKRPFGYLPHGVPMEMDGIPAGTPFIWSPDSAADRPHGRLMLDGSTQGTEKKARLEWSGGTAEVILP